MTAIPKLVLIYLPIKKVKYQKGHKYADSFVPEMAGKRYLFGRHLPSKSLLSLLEAFGGHLGMSSRNSCGGL